MNRIVQVVKRQPSLYSWLLSMVTVVFFLVGCGADIDQSVTFYRNEQWSAEIKLGTSAEMVALLGSPAEIERELDSWVTEAKQIGVDASWKSSQEGRTLIYTLEANGTGYDALKEMMFDNRTQITVIEEEGKRHIHFSQPVSRDFLDANRYTITLTGGEIISSNGTVLDRGSVQWVDPSGRMEAVLTEKSRFRIGLWLLIIALVAGIGGGGWYVWQQQNQQTAAPTRFCINCGHSLGPQAQFCPSCGQSQP
jgi:hypothetical protein